MDRLPGIRPRPSLGRRLDLAARHAFPVACTLLLMLLASVPLGMAGQAQLQPAVLLGCVFFWSLFRPAAMPALAVFLIGLLADLLGLTPVGVSVLMLLAVHGVAQGARRLLVRQSFLAVWLAFIVVAALAVLLQWVLLMGLCFMLLPPAPLVFEWVLAAALYPALAALLTRAHRGIADPGRA